MKRRFAALLVLPVLFATSPRASTVVPPPVKPKGASSATYNPDVDLDTAPEYYRKRVMEFRKLLRAKPNRKEKIHVAITLAEDRKSIYRTDAISFLGEVKATEAVPALLGLAKDTKVKEFALYSLGQIRDTRAIPLIIAALSDENENVRGNAQQALQEITRIDFGYRYFEPVARRKQIVERVSEWWKQNGATFVPPKDKGDLDPAAAEETWKKYGEPYLKDLAR